MIIAYSGKKGSGKDLSGAITQALVDKPSTFDKMDTVTEEDVMYKVWDAPTFKNVKFADKLKDIICLLLGCTRERLEDRDFKERELDPIWWYWKGQGDLITIEEYRDLDTMSKQYFELVKTTPRLLLQLMGTECGRQILHPNLWVNAVMANYKPTGEFNIIDDRSIYPDWVITDMRFPNELVSIKSKGGLTIRVNRTSEIYGGEHESETALDNAVFDYSIDNSGTIKDLVEKIKGILIKEKII